MAAVYEDQSHSNGVSAADKSDGGVEGYDSGVTTKSLLTKYSDQSIYTGTKGGSYENICDFCLYEGQGNFTSYGYPLHYRNNLNCTYRVMRVDESDVCEVDLYFHDLDVSVTSQPSSATQSTHSKYNAKQNDCREDYLEVNDRRYCGTGWRHHSDVIPFPLTQKELVFRFVSNDQTNGRGFWVEVRRRHNTCYGTRLKTQASEVCEERFTELEFEMKSPRFPNNYPLNSDCSYHVRRANEDVCGLELLFFKFDVEMSDGCAYDHLEIDGQKFCGILPDSAQKMFTFDSDHKMISFQSDSQVSKSGFHIHAKQLTACGPAPLPAPPSCNVCTSEGFGTFVSYGYPDHYRNNLFCTYTIDRRNADYCYVELEFEDFELQDSDNCEADFLQVEDQRFCSDTLRLTKRTIPFEGKDKGIVMMFRTDESKTKRGFLIKYKQLECTNDVVQEKASLPESAILPMPHSKCDYVFTDKEFMIQSENYSRSYANNLECSYYVRKNSTKVCYLELTFIKFDVEASPECQYDYLEVGNTVRLCGTLQTETVRTYIFDTNEKILRFHSDASNNRNGFLLNAEQLECMGDKIIRKEHQYSVTTPAASAVSPTHYSVGGDQSFCSQVMESQEFNIYSPNYPNPYPANQDCLFMIRKMSPNICKLEVTFDDFEIQPSDPNANCKYDFVDFNGVRVCGDVVRGDIRSYFFSSETFPIHFHSDNSVTSSDRAFRLNIRQTECEQQNNQIIPLEDTRPKDHYQKAYDCNRVYSEVAFELKSPNYPQSYPNNMNCKYTIMKQRTGIKICQLEVNFVDMDLEKSHDCVNDYLNFNGQLMCGSLSSETTRYYLFESNQFVMNFVSDSYRSQRGFFLRIRQRECPPEDKTALVRQPYGNELTQCGGIYTDLSFDLKSPQYPEYYENNVECFYRIRRRNDNICRLEIRFIDFDVEPSSGCAYDYLIIDGKKLCGDMKPNFIKSLDFTENEKILMFRTGTTSKRRGFLAKVYQKECEVYVPPTDNTLVLPPIPSICELCFTEVMGSIQSYDYPNNYPPNLSCKYKVTALPGNCMVQLNFEQFRLEYSESCDKDYLEINNIRYCGNQLEGATLLAFNKKPEDVSIRFVSNGQKSFRGFRASYTQLPCIGGVPSGQQQITLQQQEQYYQHKYQGKTQPPVQSQQPIQRQSQPSIPRAPPFTSSTGVTNYGSVPIAIVDNTNAINSSLIRVPCDRVIYDMVFEMRSPNYPNYYPPNTDCLYSIRRSNSNGEYKECVGDSLEVNGNKMCGSLPNNTMEEFSFTSYKSSIRFRSDSDISSKGFLIMGEQIECYGMKAPTDETSNRPLYYGQSSVQYATENTLSSSPSQSVSQPQPQPSYSYPSAVDSKPQQSYAGSPYSPPQSSPPIQKSPQQQYYYYRSPQPTSHSSQPKPFTAHISPSPQSGSHSDQNYEKRYTPSPSVKSYPTQQTSGYDSKTQTQYNSQQSHRQYSPSQRVHSSSQSQTHRSPQPYDKTVQSYGNLEPGADSQNRYYEKQNQSPYIEVKHKMQTNYETNVKTKCEQNIQSMYFEIKNPKESEPECLYRIEKAKENVCQLDIMFSNFDLGDQSCAKQFMEVDGQRMCGSIARNTMKTFKFSENNEIMIYLKAETMGFNNGFDIKARQVECGPPKDKTQQTYGQQPQQYSRDRMPSNGQSYGSSMQSNGFRHSPQPQPQPGSGGSQAYDGRQATHPRAREPPQTNYDGFDMRMPYRPEGPDRRLGAPVPTSEDRCQIIYTEIEFSITSVNYPNSYPSNMFCTYTIRKANPDVCAVDIKFNSFDIEDDPKCNKDYLEVDAGKICGPLPPSHERRYYFLSEEYEKVLVFKSDDSGVKSGFSLHVQQIVDCNKPWQPMSAPTPPTVCDVCHHNLRGQIMSSNYPNQYSDYMRCSYRIQAMSPDFCRVKLFLRDVDIESSSSGDCMKDALIIDSQRLCGKDISTKEMTLTFPASEPREVHIDFQSDVSGSGRGFLIEYIQESCPTQTSNRQPSIAQPIAPVDTNANSFPTISVETTAAKPDNRMGALIPPIYPPNYVSRAHIEEIVQTQVQVLDNRTSETDNHNRNPIIK
ncbi:unnamed protein product [Oppiella nova]|uniref:CUB domain-containing protein n=1 Tax=Oppiella nova TaxID=334625 RepID=A0A7R9LML3_9ACAR|nr:unnamed protein product [Oppiella nova]CAG2164515.1 unnamed protein product [Oppiella nova]